jgi:hypothetical protein
VCPLSPRHWASSGCGQMRRPPDMDGKKVKQSRYTPWRRLGERRHSSYSFSTSALDAGWVVSITPRPRFYPRGKDPRYPLDRRLGGPQSRSEHKLWRVAANILSHVRSGISLATQQFKRRAYPQHCYVRENRQGDVSMVTRLLSWDFYWFSQFVFGNRRV